MGRNEKVCQEGFWNPRVRLAEWSSVIIGYNTEKSNGSNGIHNS